MYLPIATFLLSTGLGVRRQSGTLRTTSSRRSGDKIGEFRFTAGTQCERVILSGGGNGSGASNGSSPSFASTTFLAFTAFMHFHGDQRRIRNFCLLPGNKCSNGPEAGTRILLHEMIRPWRTAKRTGATVKRICASCSRKVVPLM